MARKFERQPRTQVERATSKNPVLIDVNKLDLDDPHKPQVQMLSKCLSAKSLEYAASDEQIGAFPRAETLTRNAFATLSQS